MMSQVHDQHNNNNKQVFDVEATPIKLFLRLVWSGDIKYFGG